MEKSNEKRLQNSGGAGMGQAVKALAGSWEKGVVRAREVVVR